jgi:nicotinamide-nucleotide amidase
LDRPVAEIITIGDELISGKVINTNAAIIARELGNIGVETSWITTLGDRAEDIYFALSKAFVRAKVVVITGGLGPTPDDLTKPVITKFFDTYLELRDDLLQIIRDRYEKRGLTPPETLDEQAMFPAGAQALGNPMGTAPGIYFVKGDRHVFAVPGVPSEMENILKEFILPNLRGVMGNNPYRQKLMRISGVGESYILSKVANLDALYELVKLAFLPGMLGLDLRISARSSDSLEAESQLAQAEGLIREAVGDYIYSTNGDSIESVIGQILTNRHQSIAVAESCTGGLVSHILTNVPGSSNYFERGVITYSNRAKTELLGISPETIDQYGAVSEEMAKQMALGVRERSGTDWGASTTGIAGPAGGTEEKPVGTVWIGIAHPNGSCIAYKYRFADLREVNKQRFAQALLFRLWRALMDDPAPAEF